MVIVKNIKKELKTSGTQVGILFNSEEKRCYKLKKGQIITITIHSIEEE